MPESAPVAFEAVVKPLQAINLFVFGELRGLVDLIYNEIRLLFRFDSRFTQFRLGEYFVYLSLCNLQNALSITSA